MHAESQANRLEFLMQKHSSVSKYEIALLFSVIESTSLSELKIGDIIVTRQKFFECVILNKNKIIAKTILVKSNNEYGMKIITLLKRKIPKTQRKAHEVIKFTFGEVYSSKLKVGHTVELSTIDISKVTLMHDSKKVAKASLCNIQGEIAVKIDKVIQ